MFRVIVAKMGNIQDIESALAALMVRLYGENTRTEGLKRLSGGASQETWSLDAVAADGTQHELILRRAPGGTEAARSSAAIGLPAEAALIRAASAGGVPVPDVVHICDDQDELGDGFLMNRLAGETIGPKILKSDALAGARAALSAQSGDALARIHALDTANLPDLPESGGLAQLDQYIEIYHGFDAPRPVFDLAAQWLKAHPPKPMTPVLVHGDFRLGNLMVDETGLAGVLDWELAHLGDPREDIGWICVNSWRFGRAEHRVGGFGELEPLLDAYHAAGGADIEPVEIDWWDMLGSFKWGVMCMIMYEAFRSGADPSVERAAIGRRVSETEIDLVNLLEARRNA